MPESDIAIRLTLKHSGRQTRLGFPARNLTSNVNGLINDLRREQWAAAVPVRICFSATSGLVKDKGLRDQKAGWKMSLPPVAQGCLIPAIGST